MWPKDLCSGSMVPRLRASKRQQLFQEAGSQGGSFFTKGLIQLSWDSSQFTSCDKRTNLSSEFCTGSLSFQETPLYLPCFHCVISSTLESSVLSPAGSTLRSSRTLNSTAFFPLQMSQPQLLCYSRRKQSAVLSSLLSVRITGFSHSEFCYRKECQGAQRLLSFYTSGTVALDISPVHWFYFQQFLVFCVFL